ncbi:MAG TPA: hypothetical protein VJP87_01370, partial [Candidatus Acidoferrales bacterium]|nr:hypothetical protein [Candidatus Acidoferrales bacterium]
LVDDDFAAGLGSTAGCEEEEQRDGNGKTSCGGMKWRVTSGEWREKPGAPRFRAPGERCQDESTDQFEN